MISPRHTRIGNRRDGERHANETLGVPDRSYSSIKNVASWACSGLSLQPDALVDRWAKSRDVTTGNEGTGMPRQCKENHSTTYGTFFFGAGRVRQRKT
jgi:hypothetical protein